MKTKKFLSMAALALVGAMMTGCSNDDNYQQPENKNNVVTLTTTVSLDGGATTRALTINGNTGVKTFAAGETMAVIYSNGKSIVKAVSHALEAGDITNEGKNATFTFDLETPDKSGSVLYIYPAAMAGETGVDITKLNTQEGTFDALQSKYDLCTKPGAWVGGNLPSLTLENQLAILAINLKNGSTDITGDITGMTISDGTNNYNVNRSAAAGPIYVAIQPKSGATIEVTATDGTKNYTKTLTGKTYEAGNGYSVSWRMACVPAGVEAVDLGLSVKWANMNVGAESVTDYGKYYAWGATTDNYSESKEYNWTNTPYYTGNGSTHSWSKYASSGATLEATDDAARANWGGSWRMPTAAEYQELLDNTTRTWQTNYQGVSGCNGFLFTSKKTGYESKSIFLPAAGGRSGSSLNQNGTSGYYWSSSVDGGRDLSFHSGNAFMYNDDRYYGCPVRAVQ